MRVAVCMVGQIRTGEICYPSIRNYIGDLWPACDFFVHTWDQESKSPWVPGGTRDQSTVGYYPTPEKSLAAMSLLYKPKIMVVDSYQQVLKNYPDVKEYGQFYSMKRCNQIKNRYAKDNNAGYNYVIKLRPDVLIHKSKSLQDDLDSMVGYQLLYCDHHGRNFMSNYALEDIMFMGSNPVMEWAMNFWDVRIQSHLHGLDWQVHMMNWLTAGMGVKVQRMKNNFAGIYHDNGYLRAGDMVEYVWGTHELPESEVSDHWQNPDVHYRKNLKPSVKNK